MTVRAIYSAVAIPESNPPYDRASLKVYYPARYGDSAEERNSGVVPADAGMAPFPVVILLPGINVGPESYSWLAHELGKRGIATVTYTLVAEEMPGYVSLTPGLSLSALSPGEYGSTPSATAIDPILAALKTLNASGVLAGLLDLEHIVLGGHSAGGTVALLNARSDWFPGVCASFSYGAHAGAATALGHEEDAMFALPSRHPALIMGGTRDGCIANSSARYGDAATSPTARVERSFDQALNCDREDCYLAIIDGANHFSMAWPEDHSTGRPFIDLPTTRDDADLRQIISSLIVEFSLWASKSDESMREQLEDTLLQPHPMIARGARR